ncbi:HAD family hydrolase [Streptomyces cellulosae]|uniref:HAD family hydrolase n=1 Tax=Streptomyces cellulosae TaxID=1968 RepID=UPI0005608448|nr:HAD family phosphatase [Streptomyces cellulosae]
MTTTVRAVWSDFGGVVTPPTAVTMRDFCARTGAVAEQLNEAMRAVGDSYGTDPMAPLDTPLITQDEWTRQVEAVLLERFDARVDLSDFGAKWFAGRETNSAWTDWLRDIRSRGVFVGMLSNMVPAWDEHWRAMVPPEGLFDDLVMSFEVGLRKPQREIFELAAKRAGFAAEECVLVDDLEVNCEGARAAGWQAVHFVSTEGTIAALEPRLEAGSS